MFFFVFMKTKSDDKQSEQERMRWHDDIKTNTEAIKELSGINAQLSSRLEVNFKNRRNGDDR